jgi:hypothetical protein
MSETTQPPQFTEEDKRYHVSKAVTALVGVRDSLDILPEGTPDVDEMSISIVQAIDHGLTYLGVDNPDDIIDEPVIGKDIPRQACSFVSMSDIIPESLDKFCEYISHSCFTWGTNKFSLVPASHIHRFCKDDSDLDELEVSQEAIDAFLEILEQLGDTLVDLEN